MGTTRSIAFFLSLFLFIAGPATADVLLVDSIQSAPVMQTPVTGSSMAGVRATFGNPMTEYPTVSMSAGPQQPPITRWDYNGFSVFFEHDHVVHSVVHRASGN